MHRPPPPLSQPQHDPHALFRIPDASTKGSRQVSEPSGKKAARVCDFSKEEVQGGVRRAHRCRTNFACGVSHALDALVAAIWRPALHTSLCILIRSLNTLPWAWLDVVQERVAVPTSEFAERCAPAPTGGTSDVV